MPSTRQRSKTVDATGNDPVTWAMWGLASIVVLGAFTSMLSSTIATTAVPSIGGDLHASRSATQWVSTAYLLALAVGVPFSAWAGRRLGPTRLWLGSLALFAGFSVACALSVNLPMLIAGRVLQGLVGGLLVPAGQTILGIVAGKGRLGRITGTIGIAIVVAPTLGTTVGGLIDEHLSWSWLFWINVPLCFVALLAGVRWLPRVQIAAAGHLDLAGLVLVVAGIPLLTYGVSAIGQATGSGSVSADAYAVAGIVLLSAFTLRSLRSAEPLLRLRLFADRVFAAAAAVMFFGGAVNFGAQVVLPLYFIQARGEGLVTAGLLIGPQIIGTAIGFPLAGRLTDRNGAGGLLLAGGVITALATVPLALIGEHTDFLWLAVVLFVRGFGVALSTIPAMTAGLAAVDPDQLPDAAPLLNLLQRTGASIGTAVVAVLYNSHLTGAGHEHAVDAFGYASWWLLAGAVLLTFPAALLARAERRNRSVREAATLHRW